MTENKIYPKGFIEIKPYLEDSKLLHDLSSDLTPLTLSQATKSDLGARLVELQELAMQSVQSELELAGGRVPVEVALIGNFNSGKSSVINSLLGGPICPMSAKPSTSSITRFRYADTVAIEMTDRSGKTKNISKAEYLEYVQHGTAKNADVKRYEFDYYYPFSAFRDLVLIDTPGFNAPQQCNKEDEMITEEAIKSADVLIYVVDIEHPLGEDETERLTRLANTTKRPQALILNKADEKTEDGKKNVLEFMQTTYPNFKHVFIYSARELLENHGLDINAIWEPLVEHLNSVGRQKEDWAVTLHCKKAVSDHCVRVSFEGLASEDIYVNARTELLHYLESLRSQKKELTEDRMKRQRTSYNSQKSILLESLQASLETLLQEERPDITKNVLKRGLGLADEIESELIIYMESHLEKMLKVRLLEEHWYGDDFTIAVTKKPQIMADAAEDMVKQLDRFSALENRNLRASVFGAAWGGDVCGEMQEVIDEAVSVQVKRFRSERDELEKEKPSKEVAENKREEMLIDASERLEPTLKSAADIIRSSLREHIGVFKSGSTTKDQHISNLVQEALKKIKQALAPSASAKDAEALGLVNAIQQIGARKTKRK